MTARISRTFLILAAMLSLTMAVFLPVSAANRHLTAYKGIDYAAVYDMDFYLSHYTDVAEKFGTDEYKVLEYFVTKGMAQGHIASQNFDVLAYRAQNEDLRSNYKDNLKEYYLHYIKYGMAEGRTAAGSHDIENPLTVINGMDFSPIYDYAYYKSHNPDVYRLIGDDDRELLRHFFYYGIREGRTAKANAGPGTQPYKRLLNQISPSSASHGYRPEAFPIAAAALGPYRTLTDAFRIASSIQYFGHNSQMPSAPVWSISDFADYGFINGKGNCYVMAAMFYEMAYVLGYNPRQIAGSVRSRRGGQTPHSWIEMEVDGVDYLFDPNFTNETGRDGFMKHYGDKGTWVYHTDMIQMPDAIPATAAK